MALKTFLSKTPTLASVHEQNKILTEICDILREHVLSVGQLFQVRILPWHC
jgi:hypothetical protein